MFNLLVKGARLGELECWAAFKGECLLIPARGGWNMISFLDAAFLIGRNGDCLGSILEDCEDGIGAWSKDDVGS